MITLKKIMKYIFNSDYRFLVNAGRGKYDDMPDEVFLKRVFKAQVGYDLDLYNPKSFNAKLQWLKINDRNPRYTDLVDKIEVKKFISDIIGEDYIIPTLGIWNHAEEIDFNKLPDKFVLKCNHNSGAGLCICKDKSKLDYNKVRNNLNIALKQDYYLTQREWPYKNVKRRILAEKFMEDKSSGSLGLVDYKFFCFNGVPRFLYVSVGLENHETAKISFYDLDGQELDFYRSDYTPYHNVNFPDSFDEMKNIAVKLAEEINTAFVRIDLYSINNKVYFSEITFTPCAGMLPFKPKSADDKLGDLINLSNFTKF